MPQLAWQKRQIEGCVPVATGGFYQQTLDTNLPYQLIRVLVERRQDVFAEISGGKHRFSIRFIDCRDWQHPKQADHDVPFTLRTCLI